MKKVLFALTAVLGVSAFALLTASCGGGGGGGSDEAPSDSAPEGFVAVRGGTVTGGINGSEVFIDGRTVELYVRWACDHEVTQAEYEKYCTYTGTDIPDSTYGVGSDYPAYYVSWYDALVYCNKRSMDEGLTPCYMINESTNPSSWGAVPPDNDVTWNAATCNFNANGYRLPTEAEWEYLARGGNLSNEGQTSYSGSNTVDEVAWCVGNSDGKNHEIKQKSPNSIGLYDMSGNVAEWCWDIHRHSISTDTPSIGDEFSGSTRVCECRGGSSNHDRSRCTIKFRTVCGNSYRRDYRLGFRVVRSAD